LVAKTALIAIVCSVDVEPAMLMASPRCVECAE
jgi:hypothetical protein